MDISFQKIDVELTQYNKLPMSEIANRLQLNRKADDVRLKVNKNEERSGAVSVTAMADLLVSKFKSIEGNQPPELIRKLVCALICFYYLLGYFIM